ncbi:MAG: hypothetical protein QNJ12_08785 [Ilumatobacter sp.]|nr:hypothetical protein [Ilumatobacter sp.]MDJ0768876.1 hypothetical protein [Ilumatobacter sp.]
MPDIGHLVKSGLSAGIAVPLCLLIAAAGRRIPGVARVRQRVVSLL